jgi:hypothetical protein
MRFVGVFAASMGVAVFFAGVGALMLPLVVFMEVARTPRFLSAIIGIFVSFHCSEAPFIDVQLPGSFDSGI